MLVVASMGWGSWRWSRPNQEASPLQWTRAQPGDVWREAAAAGGQEPSTDEDPGALPWDEDPGDLGWDEDLGKEGYIVWRPKLGLQGPWTDGARPLTGNVQLLEEELPHGFCHPGIQELFLELFLESHMSEGAVRAIADNPEVLEEILIKFKSNYFKTPEIDLYGPRGERKGGGPVSSRSGKPPELRGPGGGALGWSQGPTHSRVTARRTSSRR